MSTLLVTYNEAVKGLKLTWDYKFNLLMLGIMNSIVFVGISFFIGQGELNADLMTPALLGYLVWFFAVTVIFDMNTNLAQEAQTGTLEQLYMSPVSSSFIFIGRTIATLITGSLMMVLIGVGLGQALGLSIPMNWQGIAVIGVTIFGLLGFGFMIGGATLLFKQVSPLANLLQNILLFLNGALLPIHLMPDWLAAVAKTLPTTQGIVVLRSVVLDGASLADVWRNNSLIWLIVHSATYLLAGWLIFKVCETAAKKQGTLGKY